MTVVFDESTHTYTDDAGILIPGVSQVLRMAGAYRALDKLPWEVREEARHRGRVVHGLTEKYDRGELDFSRVDAEYLGFLLAYESFVKDACEGIIESEMIVYSEMERYAGRLDRVAWIFGDRAVVDIKTGARYEAYELQLAAYVAAYREMTGYDVDGYTVYLTESGCYRTVEHEHMPDDFADFRVLCRAAHVAIRRGFV